MLTEIAETAYLIGLSTGACNRQSNQGAQGRDDGKTREQLDQSETALVDWRQMVWRGRCWVHVERRHSGAAGALLKTKRKAKTAVAWTK
jgi:hypothetical protein